MSQNGDEPVDAPSGAKPDCVHEQVNERAPPKEEWTLADLLQHTRSKLRNIAMLSWEGGTKQPGILMEERLDLIHAAALDGMIAVFIAEMRVGR